MRLSLEAYPLYVVSTEVNYIWGSHDPPAGTAWLPIAKPRREVVK